MGDVTKEKGVGQGEARQRYDFVLWQMPVAVHGGGG